MSCKQIQKNIEEAKQRIYKQTPDAPTSKFNNAVDITEKKVRDALGKGKEFLKHPVKSVQNIFTDTKIDTKAEVKVDPDKSNTSIALDDAVSKTQQATNDAELHKNLFQKIKETWKRWTNKFGEANLNSAEHGRLQYALQVLEQSANVSQQSVTKQLAYLYGKQDSNVYQDLQTTIIPLGVYEQLVNNINAPFQTSTLDTMIKNEGIEYVDKLIDDKLNDNKRQELIEDNNKQIDKYKQLLEETKNKLQGKLSETQKSNVLEQRAQLRNKQEQLLEIKQKANIKEINVLNKKMETLNNQIAKLDASKNRKAITTKENKIKEYQAEINKLTNSKLNQQIKKLENEIQKTKIDIEDILIEKRIDIADSEKRLFKGDIESFNKQITHYENDNIRLISKDTIKREVYRDIVESKIKELFGDKYVQDIIDGEKPKIEAGTYVDKQGNVKDSFYMKPENQNTLEILLGREKMYNDLKSHLIEKAQEIDIDLEQVLGKYGNYYKHIVEDMTTAIESNKTGKKASYKNPAVGDYIKRLGTTKDINNNYLYVDTVALSYLQQQIYQSEFIKTIKQSREDGGYNYMQEIAEQYTGVVGREINAIKKMYVDNNYEGLDVDIKNNLDSIIDKTFNIIEFDENIDPSLKNLLEEKNGIINIEGKDMDVFDSVNYVLEKSMEYYRDKFKNEVSATEIKNYYNVKPQHSEAINYMLGETQEISYNKLQALLNDYVSENYYVNKDTAQEMSKLNRLQNSVNKSLVEATSVKFDDYIDFDKVSVLDKMGNPLYITKSEGGELKGPKAENLKQIKIGSMLDLSLNSSTDIATSLYDMAMVGYDADYANVLLQSKELMVVDKAVANAIEYTMTPLPAKTGPIKLFNKYFRKLMILSPERLIKFNFATALSADSYRLSMTNPAALKQTSQALKMVLEYQRTGKVSNIEGQEGKLYGERQALLEAFMPYFGAEYDVNVQEVVKQRISNNEYEKIMKEIDSSEASGLHPKKLLQMYINFASNLTSGREMVLRLAYALDSAQKIDNGQEVVMGAAKKDMIQGMLNAGDNVQALAMLSNQNFIAYQEAGYMAKKLNRGLIPFFLFTEGNVKWHFRLYQNYISTIMENGVTSSKGAKAAGKMGLSLGIQIGIAQTMWNLAMRAMGVGPSDEEIPEYLKGQDTPFKDVMEETLGFKPDNYLLMGPAVLNKWNLSQDVWGYVPDVLKPAKKDKQGVVENAVGMFVGRSNPVIKFPYEIMNGADFYDGGKMIRVNPKYNIEDNVKRKLVSFLGLTKSFEAYFDWSRGLSTKYAKADTGILGRGIGYMGELALSQGNIQTSNEMSAYYGSQSLIYDYADSIGKGFTPPTGYSGEETKVRGAFKNAVRYGDIEYANKVMAEYIDRLQEEGQDFKQIQSKLKSLVRSMSLQHMGSLSKEDRMRFIQSLNQEQYEMYKMGLMYENQILGLYRQYL